MDLTDYVTRCVPTTLRLERPVILTAQQNCRNSSHSPQSANSTLLAVALSACHCATATAIVLGSITLHATQLSATELPDFKEARRVLERAVEDHAFPGCAFAVGTADRVLWTGGLGGFVYDREVADQLGLDGNPIPTEKTIYDLASLSKVVGTTSVILLLASDEKLSLDDPVARWLPEFDEGNDSRRRTITIELLLVHASGLPAWKAFYREANDYNTLLNLVSASPLETDPGTQYRYSDLGFMLLGEIAARAGGMPLAKLEQQSIFLPLNMTNTTRQLTASQQQHVPPTELDPDTQQFVRGQVHDENSRAGGGQTGHAGLFSNAEDLSRFAAEYLRALKGKGKVFSSSWAQRFIKRRELIAGSSRALGWDTPSGRSSGGKNISPNAFGHTGFTGTSMWIDPERGIYLILLTNRVHPTRDNRKISNVRHQFANAVLSALDGR